MLILIDYSYCPESISNASFTEKGSNNSFSCYLEDFIAESCYNICLEQRPPSHRAVKSNQ
jgi:hypothetical protein